MEVDLYLHSYKKLENGNIKLTFRLKTFYKKVYGKEVSPGRDFHVLSGDQRKRDSEVEEAEKNDVEAPEWKPRVLSNLIPQEGHAIVQQQIGGDHLLAESFNRNDLWDTAHTILRGFKFFYVKKDIEDILDQFYTPFSAVRTVINAIGGLTGSNQQEFSAKVPENPPDERRESKVVENIRSKEPIPIAGPCKAVQAQLPDTHPNHIPLLEDTSR